jgi:phenylpropionate dioxygenase-like ring-hydroxylating dioxygenase large terminal subunit
LHRLEFDLDGSGAGAQSSASLVPLELATAGGMLFVAAAGKAAAATAGVTPAAPRISSSESARAIQGSADFTEQEVPADWKLAVEQLLLHHMPEHDVRGGLQEFAAPQLQVDLSSQQLRWHAVPAGAQLAPWHRTYLWPNILLEWRPDGITAIQIVPLAAGHGRWQCFEYRYRDADPRAEQQGAELRARRAEALRLDIDFASSTQRGLAAPGYRVNQQGSVPEAVAAFRQLLAAHLA